MPCSPNAPSLSALSKVAVTMDAGQRNQPQLQHDIQLVFREAHALAETMAIEETIDSGHGRSEQRRLTASSALVGYLTGLGWPKSAK
jgi:hypothetical protein